MRSTFRNVIAAALFALPVPVWAEDRALLFVNDDYQNYSSVPGAGQFVDLVDDFQAAGFATNIVQNTGRDVTADQAEAVLSWMRGADRLVVVLAGHIVGAHGGAWLLHSDGAAVTPLTIGQEALPAEGFFGPLRGRPGGAVLIIADAARKTFDGPSPVTDKPVIRTAPQGVTFVQGEVGPVAAFVAAELLRPGQSFSEAAEKAPNGVDMRGFLSRSIGLVAASGLTPQQVEQSVWDQTRAANTVAAFDAYLQRYPRGRFAAEARSQRDALALSPVDRARLAEEALGLSRDQRRIVQRQLTLLGFDTRGIDGIFGRNTRDAVARWQSSVSSRATGFLSGNQINRIDAAASVRAEELRREAEARRLEAERLDQAFWTETGAGTRERGMRRYLDRYSDGLFAEEATAALQEIERQRRRQAREAERMAWDQAVMTGTVESYQGYLTAYPEGSFAEEAQAQIRRLSNPETPQAVIDAAMREEDTLALDRRQRRMIEQQLSRLTIDPGEIDGRFTRKTRRALRQFQRASNLAVTGYVTRNTIVRLVASAL